MVDVLSHPELVGVRAKLDRAKCQREILDKHLEAFRKENTNPVAFQERGDGILAICTISVRDDLGLDIGDIVHNLRSALDHTVFVLMKRHTRRERDEQVIARHERRAQFPICDTPDHFNDALERDLEGVSDSAKTVIQRLQPYKDSRHALVASPLRMLREFSDTDKHRLVTPVRSVSATSAVKATLPVDFPAHAIMASGPLENGAGIGKLYFLRKPPANVHVRFEGSFAVALYEGWTLLGGVPSIMDGIRAEVVKGVERMGRLLY